MGAARRGRPPCAGVRSPINPASRVPCCKSCVALDLSAPGPVAAPARHNGVRWVCPSQVPVAFVARSGPRWWLCTVVSTRALAEFSRPGLQGLGRTFRALLLGC